MEVKTREAAQAIGKPVGRYITAELSSPSDLAEARTGEAAAIAGELRRLLPQEGTVLVVGLGNREITPDALGPLVISDVLATRHFEGRLMEESGLPPCGRWRPWPPGCWAKQAWRPARSSGRW